MIVTITDMGGGRAIADYRDGTGRRREQLTVEQRAVIERRGTLIWVTSNYRYGAVGAQAQYQIDRIE